MAQGKRLEQEVWARRAVRSERGTRLDGSQRPKSADRRRRRQ